MFTTKSSLVLSLFLFAILVLTVLTSSSSSSSFFVDAEKIAQDRQEAVLKSTPVLSRESDRIPMMCSAQVLSSQLLQKNIDLVTERQDKNKIKLVDKLRTLEDVCRRHMKRVGLLVTPDLVATTEFVYEDEDFWELQKEEGYNMLQEGWIERAWLDACLPFMDRAEEEIENVFRFGTDHSLVRKILAPDCERAAQFEIRKTSRDWKKREKEVKKRSQRGMRGGPAGGGFRGDDL